jgi:hypothetical protein
VIAVQIKIGQKNSQYSEIEKVLGADNDFKIASVVLIQRLP